MTERPQVLGMRMGCWVAWAKHETFGSLSVLGYTPSHDRSRLRGQSVYSQLKTVTLVVAFRRVQC